MSLWWWKDTRSSRVSAFTMRKLPSFRPTAKAFPSGEKQQHRPPVWRARCLFIKSKGTCTFAADSPFLSLRTASMQWLGERSHMRRVLSSLTVAQSGRCGWVARPHTSPSMWPWGHKWAISQFSASYKGNSHLPERTKQNLFFSHVSQADPIWAITMSLLSFAKGTTLQTLCPSNIRGCRETLHNHLTKLTISYLAAAIHHYSWQLV